MRSIIITGAGGGLGIHLVGYLLQKLPPDVRLYCQYRNRGADVLAAIDPDKRCRLHQCDLTDAVAASELIGRASDDDQLWGVVNLAGGSVTAMAKDVSGNDFLNTLEQNVVTAHNVNRRAAEMMKDGGRIINISSIVATKGAIGATPYAAAKAAIEGYTISLALELARRRITVNALALGFFADGLISQIPLATIEKIVATIPMRRLGNPSTDLGAAVRFLLSDETPYITGQTIAVNGGLC